MSAGLEVLGTAGKVIITKDDTLILMQKEIKIKLKIGLSNQFISIPLCFKWWSVS